MCILWSPSQFQALTEISETKSSDVARVEEMADVLEKFDGVKKNGSTDVSSRRNDLDQNWKSFSELLQETQLRLRATHMQLKVRTCGMPH